MNIKTSFIRTPDYPSVFARSRPVRIIGVGLYKVPDGNPLQILGQFKITAKLDGKAGGVNLMVVVANVPQLYIPAR